MIDKIKIIAITVIVCLFIFGPVSLYVGYKIKKDKVIIEPGKVEYKIKYVAKTNDDLKMCYESLIELKTSWKDPFFRVTAGDACKETSQIFKIKLKDRKNFIGVAPVIGFNYKNPALLYGGNIEYSRKVFPLLLVGGGVTATNENVLIYPKFTLNF